MFEFEALWGHCKADFTFWLKRSFKLLAPSCADGAMTVAAIMLLVSRTGSLLVERKNVPWPANSFRKIDTMNVRLRDRFYCVL